MNYELLSYHPIDYKEINKMQRKVDSIVVRIRNVESRLMEKKFVGGLSEWNPLVELQARLQVRDIHSIYQKVQIRFGTLIIILYILICLFTERIL